MSDFFRLLELLKSFSFISLDQRFDDLVDKLDHLQRHGVRADLCTRRRATERGRAVAVIHQRQPRGQRDPANGPRVAGIRVGARDRVAVETILRGAGLRLPWMPSVGLLTQSVEILWGRLRKKRGLVS